MSRPTHLPDYEKPPLHEVVLGIQFSTPQGYQQIHAGEVWNLYKENYPDVKEHHPLPPIFEHFGFPIEQSPFGLITGATHDRFWFLSRDQNELIQFQNDRFLHNWRKIDEHDTPYPRYESIIAKFTQEAGKLDEFFKGFDGNGLNINQTEITYINHIPLEHPENQNITANKWLKFLDFSFLEKKTIVADFQHTFRITIDDKNNKPCGRLICESAIAVNAKGERLLRLNMTVRGKPEESSLQAAIAFLGQGRELIVQNFDAITTDAAHRHWGKK